MSSLSCVAVVAIVVVRPSLRVHRLADLHRRAGIATFGYAGGKPERYPIPVDTPSAHRHAGRSTRLPLV